MLRALVVLGVLTASAPARAQSWYEGEHGTNRIVHLSISIGGFIAYPLITPLEERWAADACRWCDPTGVDVAVRDALVWDGDRKRASRFSDVTSYGLSPGLSLGLVAFGTLADPSWAAAIDDFTPIVEAMVVTQFVTRAIKIPVGRQRPYAHYTGPMDYEDNLSFPSGHTSRAFSLVVSAAMVARARRYKIEPVIWASGLTVATASAYLRIAADKHYLTDVLAGALLGTAAGLTVPLLMKREGMRLVPARNGVALATEW